MTHNLTHKLATLSIGFILAVTGGCGSGEPTYVQYTADGGGMTIDLPKEPSVTRESGEQTGNGVSVCTATALELARLDVPTVAVVTMIVPEEEAAKSLFENELKAVMMEEKSAKLEESTHQGAPMIKTTVVSTGDEKDTTVIQVAILSGGTIYHVTCGHMDGNSGAQKVTQHVFDSIKLVKGN